MRDPASVRTAETGALTVMAADRLRKRPEAQTDKKVVGAALWRKRSIDAWRLFFPAGNDRWQLGTRPQIGRQCHPHSFLPLGPRIRPWLSTKSVPRRRLCSRRFEGLAGCEIGDWITRSSALQLHRQCRRQPTRVGRARGSVHQCRQNNSPCCHMTIADRPLSAWPGSCLASRQFSSGCASCARRLLTGACGGMIMC